MSEVSRCRGCCGQKSEQSVLVWQERTNLHILFFYIIWFLASKVSHIISRSADYRIRQGLPLKTFSKIQLILTS